MFAFVIRYVCAHYKALIQNQFCRFSSFLLFFNHYSCMCSMYIVLKNRMFVAFGNFITSQVGNPGNHESL